MIATYNQTGDPNETAYLIETYTYDSFGTPAIKDAEGIELSGSAVSNPYMFTARRYDGESGLYYYRFRMYDAELGRFLQTDPIGYYDSMNLYQYCGNNPVNFLDPWGLARIGTRPMEHPFISGRVFLMGPLFDLFNIQGAHQQIWFDDGYNIGFFADPDIYGNSVRRDDGYAKCNYTFSNKEYIDEDILLEAVNDVASEFRNVEYSLIGFGRRKWNCQSFVSQVESMYRHRGGQIRMIE